MKISDSANRADFIIFHMEYPYCVNQTNSSKTFIVDAITPKIAAIMIHVMLFAFNNGYFLCMITNKKTRNNRYAINVEPSSITSGQLGETK